MIAFGELALTREQRLETFVATAGQTVFTLADPAVGKVMFTRNGQVLPVQAYEYTGSTVTFLPAGTGSDLDAADGSDSTMRAGDVVTIFYSREVQ